MDQNIQSGARDNGGATSLEKVPCLQTNMQCKIIYRILKNLKYHRNNACFTFEISGLYFINLFRFILSRKQAQGNKDII